MHSRSNSSAEVTIKRVQGPQVDLPWGPIRGVLKGQSQNQNLLGDKLFDQLRGKAVISFGCHEGHNAIARSRAGNRNSSVHCQGRGIARHRPRTVAHHHIERRPII